MYKEMCSSYRRELANRSWELKNEDTIALFCNPVYDLKKNKAKHCNLSTSLSYPDILQQTIENYSYKVS